MKVKKYEEPQYIAVKYKEQKGLIPAIIILEIVILLVSAYAIKGKIKYEALKIENHELLKANEIKDSIISDLQEDNMKLQKKVDNL